jgi:hypothetical protein
MALLLPILKILMATNFQLREKEAIVLYVMSTFHPGLQASLKSSLNLIIP